MFVLISSGSVDIHIPLERLNFRFECGSSSVRLLLEKTTLSIVPTNRTKDDYVTALQRVDQRF